MQIAPNLPVQSCVLAISMLHPNPSLELASGPPPPPPPSRVSLVHAPERLHIVRRPACQWVLPAVLVRYAATEEE